MPNLLTYLTEIQHDSFYDRPINKLDILALTELTYLPFKDLVSPDFADKGVRLDLLLQRFEQAYNQGFPPFSLVNKDRLTLFSLLAASKRFKYIKAFAHVDEYELEQEKQFAAISYRLDRQTFVTCFRGTDDTIIGWKEDFHMTYMEEIPAQKAASIYLQELLTSQEGKIYLAGHSKGGNLALYAACQLRPELQERLLAIYCYDAPGLHKNCLQSDNYRAIEELVHPIIPQNSIVGMMLETPEKAQIVLSHTIGLLQHITFTWEVDGEDFKQASNLSENSLQVDRTLKTWTAKLSDEELRDFFDLFFGLFIQAGIERFSDITVNPLQKLQEIDRLRKELSAEEAEMIDQLIRLLFDTRYQVWKDSLGKLFPRPELSLQDWWKTFQKQADSGK